MLTSDKIAEIEKKARAAAEAFPLIAIQQVAKQYGISLRTLRRWQAGGPDASPGEARQTAEIPKS